VFGALSQGFLLTEYLFGDFNRHATISQRALPVIENTAIFSI
jgi:hypothetical protein